MVSIPFSMSTSSIQHDLQCNVEYLFIHILKEAQRKAAQHFNYLLKKKDKFSFLIIFSQRKFPYYSIQPPHPHLYNCY